MDLALHNPQMLLCHTPKKNNQPTNQLSKYYVTNCIKLQDTSNKELSLIGENKPYTTILKHEIEQEIALFPNLEHFNNIWQATIFLSCVKILQYKIF